MCKADNVQTCTNSHGTTFLAPAKTAVTSDPDDNRPAGGRAARFQAPRPSPLTLYTSIMLQHCGRAGATQSVAMRRAAEV